MKGGDNINQPKHIGDVPVEGITLKRLSAISNEAFRQGASIAVEATLSVLARNRLAVYLPASILRKQIAAEVQRRIETIFTSKKKGPR